MKNVPQPYAQGERNERMAIPCPRRSGRGVVSCAEEDAMKWTPNPLQSDIVEFTWLDLLMLALGMTVKDGALIAIRKGVKE